MSSIEQESGGIYYKRSYFRTRLPENYLYTPSHFWMQSLGEDRWKIGLTKFSVRMLGDIVELGLELDPGAPVVVGQTIGWIEGFKAISDIYGVIDGEFEKENELLQEQPDVIFRRPYTDGWLYIAKGRPEENSLDVHQYIIFLDETIEKIKGE